MTALRRPSLSSLTLDLTRRLAEDFDRVPLPAVSRSVQRAAAAAAAAGVDLSTALHTIEAAARADLTETIELGASAAG